LGEDGHSQKRKRSRESESPLIEKEGCVFCLWAQLGEIYILVKRGRGGSEREKGGESIFGFKPVKRNGSEEGSVCTKVGAGF